MNRTQLILIACALFTTPALIGAAPTPGCADFSSPGSWSEGKSDGGDSWSEVELGDGLTYVLRDYRVFLANAPGSFWFSPGDTGTGTVLRAIDQVEPSTPQRVYRALRFP